MLDNDSNDKMQDTAVLTIADMMADTMPDTLEEVLAVPRNVF